MSIWNGFVSIIKAIGQIIEVFMEQHHWKQAGMVGLFFLFLYLIFRGFIILKDFISVDENIFLIGFVICLILTIILHPSLRRLIFRR